MPSVKALEEKKKVVNEIKDKLNNSKSIVLFNYRGLTDNESKELRAVKKNYRQLCDILQKYSIKPREDA